MSRKGTYMTRGSQTKGNEKENLTELAKRLLTLHKIDDEKQVEKIIKFLCSESGSHDYTIHRREALEDLGLHIEKPNDGFYRIIKSIFDDIQK